MKQQSFTLWSPAFGHDTFLPARHTCDGRNVSPELRWMYTPEGVASFALIMEDLDAPTGARAKGANAKEAFTHWVLFDIPADRQGLPADVHGVGVPGRNDFQHNKYAGPCPPPNRGQHRYVFRLYALSVASLDLPSGAERARVEQVINENLLGLTEITARFERRTH